MLVAGASGTSGECGGAVDVSGDEGRLLFPHCVIPHAADATLGAGRRRHGEEDKEVGGGQRRRRRDEAEKEGFGWAISQKRLNSSSNSYDSQFL